MGNSIGAGRNKAKVMKITGESFKLTTPVKASQVTKDYPGHVLLEHRSVKQFGIRAKPLDPDECLESKKIYFLVDLPKLPPEEKRIDSAMRRVRSIENMTTAKERLESLSLSRRSASELSVLRSATSRISSRSSGERGGPVRVKLRLPRVEVEKLMEVSRDEAEFADKIVDLYAQWNSGEIGRRYGRR